MGVWARPGRGLGDPNDRSGGRTPSDRFVPHPEQARHDLLRGIARNQPDLGGRVDQHIADVRRALVTTRPDWLACELRTC